MSVPLPTYSGSCHCGGVKFRITADIAEMTTCDCSLCSRKNALKTAVHHTALTITDGEDVLSKYEWNTKIAKHYFCSRCGIYTFHRKRMMPDHYGVNVYCLEGFDPTKIPVRRTEGLGLTVTDTNARAEWRGPKEA